jgi:hypothetical protein
MSYKRSILREMGHTFQEETFGRRDGRKEEKEQQ